MVTQLKTACATLRGKQEAREAERRFLRRRQVEAITSLSRSQIYALMAAGSFPAPYRLTDTGTSVAWLEAEIDAWVNSRIAARGVAA